MITREEAAALLAHAPDYWMAPGDGSIENVQGATIAHVHEHANLRTMERTGESHSSADARLLAAADLARTVVALYDERDRLRDDAQHEAETLRRLLNEAHELTMATILERDEARRTLDVTNAMRDLLHSDHDALALELRRLRAAEAPGMEDAAFEGTGWTWNPSSGVVVEADGTRVLGAWEHDDGSAWPMYGLWWNGDPARTSGFRLALDAMRAAVPGSV